MLYHEQVAGIALARWVECSWHVGSPVEVKDYPVRPDGCLDIIYSPATGVRAVGTMSAEQRFDVPAGTSTVGIRFRPGMAGPFLGIAPEELTDRTIPLEDLWGRRARELESRMNESGSVAGCLQLLHQHLPSPLATPNPVQQAIEAITTANGDVDLEAIARHANLSPRQFRRRCLEESGLTPKHLCRVLRFRYALRMASGAVRPDWPDIAAGAGYFDQAHLIRDFREFAGRTPVSVFSNTANS